MKIILHFSVAGLLVLTLVPIGRSSGGDRQFARSDSDKRYLHHIDLYDSENRKITPESTKPYSTKHTCGRCHDYSTISHGWHFNAFRSHTLESAESTPDVALSGKDVVNGRQGEPWIWTDERTGTQLPLSYRDWPDLFNPSEIGIDEFEMTRHFGARTPGGATGAEDERGPNSQQSRWRLTGDLEIDCMACHAVAGAYDFERRRDTIQNENFAWAPTAALRLGEVIGSVARIKEDSDPGDEKVQSKLPTVAYNQNRFNADGTVFIDLVRQVQNNACYQCHSHRTVTIEPNQTADVSGATTGISMIIQQRWSHDQDVHIQSGMKCTDCHRNGIDHHITRGYEGETHPSGESMTTLSCVGCHLGTDFYLSEDEAEASISLEQITNRPGRLGSPLPLHAGLPPIHFEKMTCTACHSGPVPESIAGGMMTSLAHSLGEKMHRTGQELPQIRGPVFAPTALGGGQEDTSGELRVTAARAVWPAFWGKIVDGEVLPLPPDEVYAATRRALRVRRSFVEEVTKPTRENEKDANLFNEKVHDGLAAIQKEMSVDRPVYVSTGIVYGMGKQEKELTEIEVTNPDKIDMVRWPIAHNVRPAGWSLGARGCVECHADDGLLFASTVTPVGPGPARPEPIAMARLQGYDELERVLWNQMFLGRTQFKVFAAGSLVVLALVMLMGLATKAGSLISRSRGDAL